MAIGIIIQARMLSTRLPGKALLPLANKPLLWHVVDRCQKSALANQVIVATSTNTADDVIEGFCRQYQIPYFRGSQDNVLDRYYQCAKQFKLDTIVRVTSDCPLIAPELIDLSISEFFKTKTDYASIVLRRVFPRGLDCEIFSFAALENAQHHAATAEEFEHVTPYIIQHGTLTTVTVPKDYEGPFRLTVDVPLDYELIKKMYEQFYRAGEIINTKTVISYLHDHPEVASGNQSVPQKYSIH